MSALTFISPAKINLFLVVTGRRSDGFHDLLSVATPLDWGDTLNVEPADQFSLRCDDPDLPIDDNNLVLKAAAAFRGKTHYAGGARFTLEKRIPVGAGLGGGSSNAATALRALNQLAGEILDEEVLRAVASEVGSDCSLFLKQGPVVMRGRGEQLESLGEGGVARVSGRRVLVFKPGFGISTPWAYSQLAARAPSGYLPAAEAELRLARWIEGRDPAEELLFNAMEDPVFTKFPALPALLNRLKKDFGLAGRMSGSGSACFVLLQDDSPVDAIALAIREAWGESAFVLQTRLK